MPLTTQCVIPIPGEEKQISIFMHMTNQAFYESETGGFEREGIGKGIITLGSEDPVLPTAYGNFLKNNKSEQVLEIGPGNFNAAKWIQQRSPAAYHALDRTNVVYHNRKPDGVASFTTGDIAQWQTIDAISKGPLDILLCEVFDDVFHEFFTRTAQNQYATYLYEPHVVYGDTDRLVRLIEFLRQNGQNVKLSPGDLLGFAHKSDNKGNPVRTLHPIQTNIEDYLFATSLESIQGPKADFLKDAIKWYVQQVDQVPLNRSKYGFGVPLPLKALGFLFDASTRPDTRITAIDYGFTSIQDSLDKRNNPYNIFMGQVTTNVNFGLLQKAANHLGFNTEIVSVREYIKRELGIETQRIDKPTQGAGSRINKLHTELGINLVVPECTPEGYREHYVNQKDRDYVLIAQN